MYETDEEIDAFLKCLGVQFHRVRTLGAGAFGIAVLVHDDVERDQKVFKLPRDEKTTEALKLEGDNLVLLRKLLDHNIIQLYQFGKTLVDWRGYTTERYFLNMAYGGVSLRTKLGKTRTITNENGDKLYCGSGNRLPPAEALRIVIDVCRGLRTAHSFRGSVKIIHRDIKPENILIDEESGVARVADFGISRVVEHSSELVSIAGTWLYMDPECAASRTTFQSDLYSLGIVFYEMLTGELPFRNFDDRRIMPPPPISKYAPEVTEDFQRIVARMLELNVAARYAGAQELLDDLLRVEARMNPLGRRFDKISTLPDGRFLCRDTELGRHVAVRVFMTTAPVADFTLSRMRGAEAVPPSFDRPLLTFDREEYVGIVGNLATGTTIREQFGPGLLRRWEDLQRLCQLLAEACRLLGQLHATGYCHGFLSPFGIVSAQGDVRISEFGMSALHRTRHQNGAAQNPLDAFDALLPYMSPQLLAAAAPCEPTDDVFSLAAIFCAAALGHSPLSEDIRREAIKGDVPKYEPLDVRRENPLIPRRVAAIVQAALNDDPAQRPNSMAEVEGVLRDCRWPSDVVEGLARDAIDTFPENGSNGQFLMASAIIDQALSLDPGNPIAHYARGIIYFRFGSYNFAAAEFEKSAQVFPNAEIFDRLARCYERWDSQLEKAVICYRRSLEFGEHTGVLRRISAALHSLGKSEASERYARKAVELEQWPSAAIFTSTPFDWRPENQPPEEEEDLLKTQKFTSMPPTDDGFRA